MPYFTRIFSHRRLPAAFAAAAALLASLWLLTGCSLYSQKLRAPEVNTAQLQNESGDFQYENAAWGMDKRSTETALGIPFDQGSATTSSDIQIYLATDAYTMMGFPATVYCEFDGSGLTRVSFRITPAEEDSQLCWDTLTAALFAQYGSTDPVYSEADAINGQTRMRTETCLWEHSGSIRTAMSAMKISIDGNPPMIELFLYVIPADRK